SCSIGARMDAMRRLFALLLSACSLDESGLGAPDGSSPADVVASSDAGGADSTMDAGADAIADVFVEASPDAMAACQALCTDPNASCVNGVCVFDCTSTGSCPGK